MTQLTAPVLLASLSPLKGKRQLSVTINAPATLQTCSDFRVVALQTHNAKPMMASQLALLGLPTHHAPSARAARPTSPSSGADERLNSSPCFGGKLLPFLIELKLAGIDPLTLRKGAPVDSLLPDSGTHS